GRRSRAVPTHKGQRLDVLVREWLLSLTVMGRSARTIHWYRQKVEAFLDASALTGLEQLIPVEVKAHLASLQERGLADNTVHGAFEVIKALASWADREGYAVDEALL